LESITEKQYFLSDFQLKVLMMKAADQMVLSLNTQLAQWVENTNMKTKKRYFVENDLAGPANILIESRKIFIQGM